jgi:hypothetical protein
MSIISTDEMGNLHLCDANDLDLEKDRLVFLVFLERRESSKEDKEKEIVVEKETRLVVDGFLQSIAV